MCLSKRNSTLIPEATLPALEECVMNELHLSPKINVGGLTVDGPHAIMSRFESLGQLIAARPTRARVLEKWGIPFCTSKHQTLWEACADHSVDVRAVLTDLRENDARALGLPHCEHDFSAWTHTPLNEFAKHLTEMHHNHLRSELTRLSDMLARVAGDHGGHFFELWDMESLFLEFEQQSLAHLESEEQCLFPLLASLDHHAPTPAHLRNAVANMIATFCTAHGELRVLLQKLRELTRDFTPPETACTTYRVLLYGLAELEVEVQRHFGEEEENLFPRILEAMAEAKR
jgi:regulator of cell morphogenesis and NO signaling